MKKEEFPTFLNEQATIIFGRTGRELLIISCGIVTGYSLWANMHLLFAGAGWTALTITLVSMVVILSLVVAMLKIASRTLEEWFFIWLVYTVMPRVYMYQPLEEEEELLAAEKYDNDRNSKSAVEPFEED